MKSWLAQICGGGSGLRLDNDGVAQWTQFMRMALGRDDWRQCCCWQEGDGVAKMLSRPVPTSPLTSSCCYNNVQVVNLKMTPGII